MSVAAQSMQSASSGIDDALRNHQRFLDAWLDRFEAIVLELAVNLKEVE